MLPNVRAATASEIPVIDLKNFKFSDAEKAEIVELIGKTARDTGFFYIINHGIEPAAIDGIFETAKQFFDLPMDAKEEVSLKKSGYDFHGYLPSFHKGSDTKLKENLQEAYQIHLEHPANDPLVVAKTPLYGPNLWPTEMPDLRDRMVTYQNKLRVVGDHLVHLFALAMGLPEDALDPYFKTPTSMLRLLHYPPQQPDDSPERIGTRAHTDTGGITILSQDDVGGLEVMLKTGEWVGVPPKKYSYVINFGEVMSMWSDGIFAATPHRVINRYGKERYSVPYFANPEYHATFVPKVKNLGPRDEKFEKLISNKGHQCYGDWIMDVYTRIYNDPTAYAG
jgi:isopenicillin N synthase-like dioxygenase